MRRTSTSEAFRSALGAVGAASAVSTIGVLPVFLLGAIAVLVRDDLGFSEVRLGIAVSLFWAAAALFSVPSGWVAERLGGRSALVLAAGVSGLSLLAAAGAGSWAALAAALVVAGIGNALSQLAANLRLVDSISVTRQGIAFGVKQAAVPAATLAGGVAVPAIALPLGWRWALTIAAVTALAFGALQVRGMRDVPFRRRSDVAPVVLMRAPLIALGVAGGFGAAAANAMAAFLVEYCVSVGVGPGAAGLILAIGSAAAMAARVFMGWLADRREGGNLLAIAALLAIGAGVVAALPLVSGFAAILGFTIVAYATGWGWPGLFHFTIVRRNPQAPAAATGVTQVGVYVGGVAGPLVFGVLVASFGYSAAWWATAASLIAAAGLMLISRALARRAWLPADGRAG